MVIGLDLAVREQLFVLRSILFNFPFCLQLLSQLESSGPPPADKDKIATLPITQITQKHIGRRMT